MGIKRFLWLIAASAVSILTALYTHHAISIQSSRESLRTKIAPLTIDDSGQSLRELAQSVRLIKLDIPKRTPALRNTEQSTLSELEDMLDVWRYFSDQVAGCKKITSTDSRFLNRAGLASDPAIHTSPDLNVYLETAARAKLMTELMHAGQLPGEQAAELGAYYQTLKGDVPSALPDFYDPIYCRTKVEQKIHPLAKQLTDSLAQRKWL